MPEHPVLAAWREGRAALCGWHSTGSPYGAEVMGRAGLDAVLVDRQHGMIGTETMIACLQAISSTLALPAVRLPRLDEALAMHALDAGAGLVVCPMIDGPEEARAFVAATTYPPRGRRSFGPARALFRHGPDYMAEADAGVVRLAMIETRAGLEALDAILATPGLDGVFVGPADLGLALGQPPLVEPAAAEVVEAIARIRVAARRAGRRAGIFCASPEGAARAAAEGFDLVVPGNDAGALRAACARAAEAVGGARPMAAREQGARAADGPRPEP